MIIIRGLNKAFGEKIIFSNFNLEIPDGSFVVISGDSGSGKSQKFSALCRCFRR